MYKHLLFISFLVLVTHATEYGCTYKSKSGDFYDLSTLSKCDLSGYAVSSTNDGNFKINVCNDVNGCTAGSSSCQSTPTTFDCGHASQSTFSDYGGTGKGLVLTYKGGATCPGGEQRQTVLTFICDQNAAVPQFTFVSEQPGCTYNFNVRSSEACPKPEGPQKVNCMLNVFLIPHTHDDVGWLQTVEGYYTSQVRNILDTAVASLLANPKRTFIYVEQAYFTLWWNDPKTTDQQRNAVKTFVKEGRWEFVIGAWVMPDEACTTYGAITDQMTLGHQFLLNNFGVTPTKGWQIDPFGASSVTPVLEKLAGFDAHLLDRITNKGTYEQQQKIEFYWQGVPSLGKKGEIFTEMMGGGGYCDWLSAFNFDNDPVNPSNVASYGQKFAKMAQTYSTYYKTPNVMAEWGCDFAFQHADKMFHSMDQVVDWLQANVNQTQVNVKYTVLSDYYKSVWADAASEKFDFPVKEGGDFFPLLDGGQWWTGYFTSRVELKGYVRQGEAASHVAEPLYSLGRVTYSIDSNAAFNQIYSLRVYNGYAQHHDGVTGTSVPEVVEMYKDDLISGMSSAYQASSTILEHVIQKGGSPLPSLQRSTNAITNIGDGQTVALLLYNSLGWTQNSIVVIPVNKPGLVVTDDSGTKIPAQISTTLGPNVTSKYELFFHAKVPGLGFSTYFVSSPASFQPIGSAFISKYSELKFPSADLVFENSVQKVTISGTTGLVSSVTNKKSGVNLNLVQNIEKYTSQKSGAYAFKPTGPATPVSSGPPKTSVTTGPVVNEIQQTFSDYAKQTIRLFNASGNADVEGFFEINFELGNLPSHTEVISSFSTPLNTGRTITTDDNGFDWLTRPYNTQLGIEANYYPMVYGAYINDNNAQVTVLSERSHGAGSEASGELEVMVHRNPDMGDGFGPTLTDTSTAYPVLRVVVDTPTASHKALHLQPYFINFPLISFTSVAKSAADWSSSYVTQKSFLSADLPPNVHLLSLNALDASSKGVILRLTHLYATGEDSTLSQPVSIDLAKLFSGVTISSVKETTLSANKVLSTLSPMAPVVVLEPKDIRTFVVEFST